MSDTKFSSFERAFPAADFVRGKPFRAVCWAIVGGILLAMLLGSLYLIFSVLEGRGTLVLPNESFAELSEISGQSFRGDTTQAISGQGILSAAWHSRSKPLGGPIAWLYRTVPALQSSAIALFTLLVFAITVAFLRTLVSSRISVLSNSVGFETAFRLRQGIHRQNLRLGPGNLVDKTSQKPFDLFTHHCDQVRDGVSSIVRFLSRHVVDLCVLLAFVITLHPRLSLQCLIPLGFFWYLMQLERTRFDSSRDHAGEMATSQRNRLASGLRKTRLVRGYNMDSFEKNQFQSSMERLRESVAVVKKGESWLRWLSAMLIVICGALVFCMMGLKILLPPTDRNSLTAAAGVAMVIAFALMHFPLSGLLKLKKQRQATNLSASRIYRYLDRIPEVGQAVGAKFLQPMSRVIQFESVGYSIPNKGTVLQNFDLKINAGEKIAFVSLDPLEALAAVSLLPRFIEPGAGRVLYDGEDIAWVTLESLRAETAFVAGTDSYFPGTVLENITCGVDDYSLQQATDAARTTHAHNFVIKLPNGYETVLGDHGTDLDPGQAFRLALARAVVRNPAIMIIEEPPEQLDDDTKSWIEDAYARIARDRTVMFLPNRLSTVRKADRIVLIHQGKVEAIGAHDALVRSAAIYRHWEYVHFNEFRSESNDKA